MLTYLIKVNSEVVGARSLESADRLLEATRIAIGSMLRDSKEKRFCGAQWNMAFFSHADVTHINLQLLKLRVPSSARGGRAPI